ncbi:hypothetical protein SNE40_004206 [Patella caerulea]|uniref:CUB domain-containing protein n=1 Tax=Patella caerulea TaxID=87958 RepID=A0AAN8KD94_PATCE
MVAIAFHSDGSHSAKGFNISYETFNSDGNCNLDIDVYTFDGYLIPLNYPHWFKRGLKCVYRLHKAKKFDSNYKIVVSVVFCDLPPKVNQQCTTDYVNVYDGSVKNSQDKVGTFCGNENNFTVRANSTSVLIDFVTAANSSGTTAENSSGYYKGFRIKYMLEEITRKITCSVERPLQLTASTTVQYFTSPNYPNNYENDQYCQWRITTANYKTIRFEVIDSDLGPKPAHDDADYVKVYDGYNRKGDLLGKLYSTYTPTYVSSDFHLFIEFKSNSNGVYKGFKVKYYTTSDSVPNSLPDGVSVEISLIDTSAGAIGGIVSTIAFLIICMCVILRDPCRIRKNRQRRQSRQSSQTVVYDANSTSSPPPYSEVRNPEYDIAPPSYPENIPSVAPPPYSELPAYEDAAINYEIAESRSHPGSNPVTEPKRQISRDDLIIRRNPQSELPTYEDSANYEIRETRGHPEQNPVPEPQRQTSRDDLRRRNSQSELPA